MNERYSLPSKGNGGVNEWARYFGHVRARVPWMNEVDDAILEFFEDLEESTGYPVSLPPTAVYVNLVEQLDKLDRSSNTVSRRMGKLADMGFLEIVDEKRRYYRITEMGRQYLTGELDAEDIPRPEDD